MVPQTGTKAVTVLTLVATGSKNEKKEISGISHFLEHMLFKGTKKRPTPKEISEPIEGKGGLMNAFTSEDLTGYYMKLDTAHVDLALEIESDVYLNSLLPPAEIKKEKGVVKEEINMYRDSPMRRISELWSEVLYGDQPAGWNIAGTKETVSSITRAKLRDYMESQYKASNTVVCVAGDIDQAKVEKKVKSLFGHARSGDLKYEKPVVLDDQKEPRVMIENRKTDQTHIALGVKGFTLLDEECYAQDVLADLLGGMMSSRLFGELREKMGAAYYLSTMSDESPDSGSLVTRAGVRNSDVEKSIKVILREYKRMAKNAISPQELKKGKDHYIGKMVLQLESTDSKAEFYGVQELLLSEVLTPDEVYAKIKKIKASDIKRVAERIFVPECLNLAVLGPYKDEAHFKKLLKI